MKARHGLVIGKFYPPHAGHHLLVRTAAGLCDRVSVVVMASSVESIPLEARVKWMRELHAAQKNVEVAGVVDDQPVDYEDAAIWDAHVALMRQGVRALTADPVDAVFTSEKYGEELARRFGARHACVDLDRVLAPISGTRVRADPIAAWDWLAPPVRAWFAKRIVLVGAESTGKSTLAAELAQQLRMRGGAFALTRWVPEHGREYSVEKLAAAVAGAALEGKPPPAMEELVWTTPDFEAIAREQNAIEDAAAREGGPVLIGDTDAFATGVWHERYMGARAATVDAIGETHRPALYLLTHHDDVPFAQDGVRDGEKIRGWMTGRFVERLNEDGRPFRWIRGSREERLKLALSAIDRELARGWSLASPLG